MTEIEVKQKLLFVAEIITRSGMHPAPLSKGQAEELTAVVDERLVEIEDDQIAFVTPELLATWVSHYCAMRISDVWEDLDQTAQELDRTYYLFRTLALIESAATQLFLSLENDCGKSLLARLEEAARLEVRADEPNVPLRSIYFNFCDVLPELGYTPSDLANHLGPVLDATENYLPRGKLHGAIERLAGQSQEKAEDLLDTFLQRTEQRTVELAANALKSLWKFVPDKAHRKAIELTEAKLTPLKRIGTIALVWFDYELPSYEGKLLETIDRLQELCKSNETKLLPTIAQAFGDLYSDLLNDNQLKRIQKGILDLASREEPEIQHAMAQVLVRKVVDYGAADWIWAVLNCLSGVQARNKGTLQELDLTTFSLFERHPERVATYLGDVVMRRQYGREGESDKLPDLYRETVFRLVDEQQPILESTITRWFASKDRRLHAAAADLVGCFVKEQRRWPGRTIQLDSSELDPLGEENVQRVICALTGYVEDYKALASLLISVLSRGTVSKRVRELIVNALNQVVLHNMPGLAGEYLRGLTQDADIQEYVRQVITDALDLFESYHTRLSGRPNLKELIPPDIRVHRFHAEFDKQFSHHMGAKAFHGSGLLSHITKIPVKYGQASFSLERGTAESFVPMRLVQTDVELPRELIIDPFGHEINRMQWKIMAVNGIPTESRTLTSDNSGTVNEEKRAE